jgi:hypothetical protein
MKMAGQAGNMGGSTSRYQGGSGGQGMHGGTGGSYSEQAQSAMRNAADSASEMWDDAYEQGERYYRQGSQALGNVDGTTLTGWMVAGAIGFGLAWLMFGPHSRSGDYMTRRMSESSSPHR